MKFMFYKSYFDSLSCIRNSADRWKVLDAIFKYMESGRIPKLSKNLMSCFFLIKPIVDSEAQRMRGNPNFAQGKPNPYYEKRTQRSAENGSDGFEAEQNGRQDHSGKTQYVKVGKKIIGDNSAYCPDNVRELCDSPSKRKSFEREKEIEDEKESEEERKRERNLEVKKQAKIHLHEEDGLQSAERMNFEDLSENVAKNQNNNAKTTLLKDENDKFAEYAQSDLKDELLCKEEKSSRSDDGISHSQVVTSGRKRSKIPPTIEEIQAYIDKHKLDVKAEVFFDFYESKGWFVGKNKMSSFEASLRNWDRYKKSEKLEAKSKKRSEFGFEQREYSKEFLDSLAVTDLDSIEF